MHTGIAPCEGEGRDKGNKADTKEHQRTPQTTRSRGGAGEAWNTVSFAAQPSERTNHADTLTLDFQPLEL